MDLGGGSVELNYITSSSNSQTDENPRKRLKTSSSPVSLPYGAVVMKNKLSACKGDPVKLKELEDELIQQFKYAKDTAQIPDYLQNNGFTVYMSGGGFRAIGYLSMADHHQEYEKNDIVMPITPVTPTLSVDTTFKKPSKQQHSAYPIPIITGYSMTGGQLTQLVDKYKHCNPDKLVTELKAFRISKRRTKMLPATCFLVSAMLKVLPINKVYFSEGGVRQGLCYYLLPPSEREKDPLLEGIQEFIEPLEQFKKLPSKEYLSLLSLINSVIPPVYLEPNHPFQLHRLVPAALLLANMTTHYPKESRASVAFQMPLASGPFANVAGLLHSERSILALLLAYRQGGEIADPLLLQTIESRVGKEAVSVCRYIGKLMQFIFTLSPRVPSLAFIASGIQLQLQEEINSYVLKLILPQQQDNFLVDSPGVMDLVKSMDKKIQVKKWNSDIEEHLLMFKQQRQTCDRLFSIELIHS